MRTPECTENMNSDELYNWCMTEYNSSNVILKYLINKFYGTLETKILKPYLDNIESVLEVGCGAGESSQRIHKMLGDRKFDPTEYDDRYIEAIERCNYPFKVTKEDVYKLTKSHGEYDCVVMLEVLEHLENYKQALKELFRVSSRYVIISVPNEPTWSLLNLVRLKYFKSLGNTPGHINHWNKRRLSVLLGEYGKVLNIVTTLPWVIAIVEKK